MESAAGGIMATFQSVPFPWHGFLAAMSFVFGACIGSFLNVCIHRIPRDMSVVSPRSHCPTCQTPIAWYHNIPLMSWLLLRGRCRYCGAAIVPRYFLVELLVAVLFLMVWLMFDNFEGPRPLGMTPLTDIRLVPVYWLFAAGLVMGTFVDFEHLIIPDRVTLGGIAAGLLLSALVPSLHGEESPLRALAWSGVGAAAGWCLLWGVAFVGSIMFKREAMGFGDVKLIGAIGAFLGWQAVLFTVVISSLLGSVVGISLVAMGKKEMQSRIPYGPYLSLAALIWVFWGWPIWDAYVDLLTPDYPYMP